MKLVGSKHACRLLALYSVFLRNFCAFNLVAFRGLFICLFTNEMMSALFSVCSKNLSKARMVLPIRMFLHS